MTPIIEYIKPFSTRGEEKIYTRITEAGNKEVFQYEIKSVPFIKNFSELNLDELILRNKFKTTKEFWDNFIKDENWIIHRPLTIQNDELIDLIGVEIEKLEREERLPKNKMFFVSSWKKYVRMKEQPNQYCAKCDKQVVFNPRYPKYICENCASLDKKDESGYILTFSNVSMSGGLRICYWENGKIIKEDTSQRYKSCYIDEEEYIVKEAKFGGVVIQKMKKGEIL